MDRGGSPERGSIYDEEAEALSIKYEASRKALADSMAKNREYEAHINRLEAAASGKSQSSALVDHTRKQLAEAKNEIARLLNQVRAAFSLADFILEYDLISVFPVSSALLIHVSSFSPDGTKSQIA